MRSEDLFAAERGGKESRAAPSECGRVGLHNGGDPVIARRRGPGECLLQQIEGRLSTHLGVGRVGGSAERDDL